MKKYLKVEISDITPDGFNLRIHSKVYYVARETYQWFLGATDEELMDVWATPGNPDDHGDHLCWESLDVDLGLNDFDFPPPFPPCMFTKAQLARYERYRKDQVSKSESTDTSK